MFLTLVASCKWQAASQNDEADVAMQVQRYGAAGSVRAQSEYARAGRGGPQTLDSATESRKTSAASGNTTSQASEKRMSMTDNLKRFATKDTLLVGAVTLNLITNIDGIWSFLSRLGVVPEDISCAGKQGILGCLQKSAQQDKLKFYVSEYDSLNRKVEKSINLSAEHLSPLVWGSGSPRMQYRGESTNASTGAREVYTVTIQVVKTTPDVGGLSAHQQKQKMASETKLSVAKNGKVLFQDIPTFLLSDAIRQQ